MRAICWSAGTTDLSCFRTSRRCAVSRHQPFGCVKCATSCAGVSLYIRGGAKSGAIAGIAGWPMLVSVAGTAGAAVVAQPPDAAVLRDLVELILLDLRAQVASRDRTTAAPG